MKKIIALLAASLFLLNSCATRIAAPAKAGSVDHIVLLWMKNPDNAKEKQALVDAANRLRVIGGIQFLDHGTALPSERPVVDDSFDLGLVMRFDSPDTLQAYETDPRHVKEVTEVLRPLTKKIQVYDIRR